MQSLHLVFALYSAFIEIWTGSASKNTHLYSSAWRGTITVEKLRKHFHILVHLLWPDMFPFQHSRIPWNMNLTATTVLLRPDWASSKLPKATTTATNQYRKCFRFLPMSCSHVVIVFYTFQFVTDHLPAHTENLSYLQIYHSSLT